MTSMTTNNTFLANVEGSSGTVVLGQGIPAITGHVEAVGDDYLAIRADDPYSSQNNALILVPVAAISYYRFEESPV